VKEVKSIIDLKVDATDGVCPIGETIGKQNQTEGKILVLSCEGACIRGEIARLAANMVAKEDGYGRGWPWRAVYRTSLRYISVDQKFR
jgi:hypothetical protein